MASANRVLAYSVFLLTVLLLGSLSSFVFLSRRDKEIPPIAASNLRGEVYISTNPDYPRRIEIKIDLTNYALVDVYALVQFTTKWTVEENVTTETGRLVTQYAELGDVQEKIFFVGANSLVTATADLNATDSEFQYEAKLLKTSR